MARQCKAVVWTYQARINLDAAIEFVSQDSITAAKKLLENALDSASSLSVMSERGRMVPEFQQSAIREIFVQPYRMIYEVFETRVEILAFIHGARDFGKF